MKRFGTFWFFIMMMGCGAPALEPFTPLADQQPAVVSITPADGESAYNSNVVEVVLSKAIDPKTIDANSFLVTQVAEGEVDSKALWKQLSNGKVKGVEGIYEVSEDGLKIRFVATKIFPPAVRCGVLVTPNVLTKERIPIQLFFSSFWVKGEDSVSDGGGVPSQESPTTAVARPSFLRLNEIFYDAVGNDADGDLFIELWGESEKDLGDYQVVMVNGADGKIVDSIKIPKGMKTNADGFFVVADAVTNQPGITKVEKADWVTNFDPPNGPDCMQLLDPDRNLVDVVGYGSPLVLRAENGLLCYEGTPASDVPSGKSLGRKPDTEDQQDNAQDWMVLENPTPGR